jgi:hypothetical protein
MGDQSLRFREQNLKVYSMGLWLHVFGHCQCSLFLLLAVIVLLLKIKISTWQKALRCELNSVDDCARLMRNEKVKDRPAGMDGKRRGTLVIFSMGEVQRRKKSENTRMTVYPLI